MRASQSRHVCATHTQLHASVASRPPLNHTSQSSLHPRPSRCLTQGGSVGDTDLSASQLRARYGVGNNAKDFSTRDNDKGSSSMVVVVLGALAVIGLLAWLLRGKFA